MKISLLLLALTLTFSSAFSQDTRFWLGAALVHADTVWLISHKDIRGLQSAKVVQSKGAGSVQRVTGAQLDSMAKLPVEDQLLLNGRLNPSLINTQKPLPRPYLDSLAMILTAIIEFDHVDPPLCFDPHNAIVWSKDGKLSYIDLCFHCHMYSASSDLTQLRGKNFGARKWAALEKFFTQQGLH
jgi:hypothetical protein